MESLIMMAVGNEFNMIYDDFIILSINLNGIGH